MNRIIRLILGGAVIGLGGYASAHLVWPAGPTASPIAERGGAVASVPETSEHVGSTPTPMAIGTESHSGDAAAERVRAGFAALAHVEAGTTSPAGDAQEDARRAAIAAVRQEPWLAAESDPRPPAVGAAAASVRVAEVQAAAGSIIQFATSGSPDCMGTMWDDWAGNNTTAWYAIGHAPGAIWCGSSEPADSTQKQEFLNVIPVSYSGADAASVNYTIAWRTAAAQDIDNPPASGTVYFPGSNFTPQIAYVPISTGAPPTGTNPTYLRVVGDTRWEGPETVEITLRNPTNATLGSVRSAMVTLLDSQAAGTTSGLGICSFQFSEVRVAENGRKVAGSKQLTAAITVVRQHSPTPTRPMPVTIKVIGGSAVLGTDYSIPATTFTVIIPSLSYSTTFNVTIAPDDPTADGHKDVIFQIVDPDNNRVGMDPGVRYAVTGCATGVQDTCRLLIVDNESPDPGTGIGPTGSAIAGGAAGGSGCGGGTGLAACAVGGLVGLLFMRLRRRR